MEGSSALPLTVSPMDVMPPPPELLNGDHEQKRSQETGYVYDTTMMLHKELRPPNDDGSPNPEVPMRIKGIWESFRVAGLIPDRMVQLPVRDVTRSEVLLVHSEDLWDRVDAIQHMSEDMIISSASYYEHLSLYVHPLTTKCALLSCGSTIEAALAVATGKVRNAFAIVRPPGHHAEPEEHMGFCFFNNVSVAARVIQEETDCKRILILDWDVHHGNGTQRAFWDDPTVLYISLHRYDGGSFYPGGNFGSMEMVGEGAGVGYCVNIPWPEKGMGDADYLYAFQQLVMPIAYEFAPDMVIISAGFDAAEGDILGECHVSPAGYAHMTHMLSSLAGGKVCVALEGGYNVDSISKSALAVAKVLLGENPPSLPSAVASEVAVETVWLCGRVQSRYWRSIVPKVIEPRDVVEQPTYTMSEILKLHRARHMYTTHQLMDVPLHDSALNEMYSGQVLVSPDIYLNKRAILVFLHDFGDLHVDLRGLGSADMNLEKSYLVDASDSVVAWAKRQGWAICDINVLAKPLKPKLDDKEQKTTEKRLAGILEYIWDNYVQLSECRNVVLMSYGMGTMTIASLLKSRAVNKKVRAVVHVLGYDSWPSLGGAPADVIQWYKQNSLSLIPKDHPGLLVKRLRGRLGEFQTYEETRLTKTLGQGLPTIDAFIQSRLADMNGAVNGGAAHVNGDVPMVVV
ncbi:Arginase/deacetylase [Exidia glandulosa HHB12029]|uniref:histone deacetylase n=1 Tax=Exidia glandulosa HHB12029 TaxID=1314781 RepID=A0A165F3V7_EXIGL|nr:Arginase/deacetylase [Exidia glandulosa HHB12029]